MKWAIYTYQRPNTWLYSEVEYIELARIAIWTKTRTGFRSFGEAHNYAIRWMRENDLGVAGLEPYTGSGRYLLKEIMTAPHCVVLRLFETWPPEPQALAKAEDAYLGQAPF
jgi:hypothetical protein